MNNLAGASHENYELSTTMGYYQGVSLVGPLVEEGRDGVAAPVEDEDDSVLRLPAGHGLHRDGRLQQLALHGAHEPLALHRLQRPAKAGPEVMLPYQPPTR